MAKVLCFGDSNTWGATPNTQSRYDDNERWTALLTTALADIHEVIESGQPNRTIVNNPPFSGAKTGPQYLVPLLELHSPNLVIIMLGTNDLKNKFSLTPEQISQAAYTLIKQIQNFKNTTNTSPKVLLLCPPPIYEVGCYSNIYKNGHEKSKVLSKYYLEICKQLNCHFFDVATVVTACKEEGIHWPVKQHQNLAEALIPIIKKILL
ncbi:G-D-S-L family lipolytic protein [Pseudoalteromonas sp. NBT06-2]|uniref:SGNH/GDSL hydrolase family protein n=1 Tax=Pseudoalteromonas sp. NBT06-2 TaxID=2025950 RepID=UPI000BA75FF5|nr:SGNH/GDSL hydrolase family protein [Pseudoalteromonas sp. NBT06-2]PAJ72080.1 G-D-S-L family lipolytic protein [Pseudoalteromonas sp. NBT06-2]